MDKAQFERRNAVGVQVFKSYWHAWWTDAVELICKGIMLLLFLATVGLLFKAFVPD